MDSGEYILIEKKIYNNYNLLMTVIEICNYQYNLMRVIF